jgi:lantibiotic modifying enzyme
MLQLFARHPDFELLGHDLMYWSRQYVHGNRGSHVLEDGNCGMSSECIAIDVMRACVTKDRRYVMALLEHMPRLLAIADEETGDKFPAEMIVGRAGMLHMFRMVRHWVPDCADLIEDRMRQLARRIVDKDDDGKGTWMFRNTRYFGAPHGDIGTVVQILLCDPSHAHELAALVEELLDLQTPEGNWIRSAKELDEGKQATLVQYCHGAPGFVYALQSLRPFYPELGERIDRAIERAREVTWEKGLLKKEPSLCHGILGNAL